MKCNIGNGPAAKCIMFGGVMRMYNFFNGLFLGIILGKILRFVRRFWWFFLSIFLAEKVSGILEHTFSLGQDLSVMISWLAFAVFFALFQYIVIPRIRGL